MVESFKSHFACNKKVVGAINFVPALQQHKYNNATNFKRSLITKSVEASPGKLQQIIEDFCHFCPQFLFL